ncbi:MAG TPA: hypothetical protein VLU47_10865 [Blastocatellia bacterium]|nr:hypothetical protein [Blastocatellia bacterium]
MVRSYPKKVDCDCGRTAGHRDTRNRRIAVVARAVEGSSRRRRTTYRLTIEEVSERHIDAKPVQFRQSPARMAIVLSRRTSATSARTSRLGNRRSIQLTRAQQVWNWLSIHNN